MDDTYAERAITHHAGPVRNGRAFYREEGYWSNTLVASCGLPIVRREDRNIITRKLEFDGI
jgi:hypothetical protein